MPLQQGNEEIRLLQSLQDSSYGLNYVDLSMSRSILNTLSRQLSDNTLSAVAEQICPQENVERTSFQKLELSIKKEKKHV